MIYHPHEMLCCFDGAPMLPLEDGPGWSCIACGALHFDPGDRRYVVAIQPVYPSPGAARYASSGEMVRDGLLPALARLDAIQREIQQSMARPGGIGPLD